MSRVIMLIPVGVQVGLTSISLGIIHAMKQACIRFNVLKPISQVYEHNNIFYSTINILRKYSDLLITDPIKISVVENLLINKKKDILLERIMASYHTSITNAEIILVEGLASIPKKQFLWSLNYEIAKMLNAKIVFIIAQETDTLKQIKERINLDFSSLKNINIEGIIINKLNAPIDQYGRVLCDLSTIFSDLLKTQQETVDLTECQKNRLMPIIGMVPWNFDLITVRAIDIANRLSANIINEGDINNRRIKSITFCSHAFTHILENHSIDPLLIIPVDRHDLLIAACLAIKNGTKISALLLTGGNNINYHVSRLCKYAFLANLPVLLVDTNTRQTLLNLKDFSLAIPIDDWNRIKKVQEYISSCIDKNWIQSLRLTAKKKFCLLSPPAFRYKLTQMARKANKCIILPEGEEPRTIKAAIFCAERGIATCILLGDQEKINQIAISQELILNSNIKVIDPNLIYEKYIDRLVKLRADKGMTEDNAREQLKDNIVLGTLMLEKGEVDGLVSGTIHTTASTIRPSLQLIKTAPDSSLVSSIFFMLLPEKVYIYGDCAINQDPTPKQLAEIAIQSANTAIKFGIHPYVAMLSYSTGLSGTGSSVEKVREATRLVKEIRKDLIVDGPLQYDAAVIKDVAKLKAPYSSVAGRATVLIFPDLNAGNIAYKAVQRSTGLSSIGPILQGMRKPVNDLSRGALVEDIIYTIAVTAIQANQ